MFFFLLFLFPGCKSTKSIPSDVPVDQIHADTKKADTANDKIQNDTPYDSIHNDVQKSDVKKDVVRKDTPVGDTISPDEKVFRAIKTIKDLDEQTLFRFALFSDNKGLSPKDATQCKHMCEWDKEVKYPFILGLGDHLKYKWDNTFLDYIKDHPEFTNRFYPTLADGENEFYSPVHSQGDHWAGKPFLELVGVPERKNVTMRKNGCEYYAKIPILDGKATLHLISANFPDTPSNPDYAFPKDSRQWIVNTVKSINKGPNDIIMVLAHSINGSFNQYFTKAQKDVLKKADFLIAATTHIFKRYEDPDFGVNGPIILNSGQVTGPMKFGGYFEFSILKPGNRVFVQYVCTNEKKRVLADNVFRFLKVTDGPTFALAQ